MWHLILPYLQTLGVLLLAVAGVVGGRQVAKLRKPVWLLAYFIVLAVVVAIALARRLPHLEFMIPFSWIMAGRTEFAILALLITSVITIPAAQLPGARSRLLVYSLMGVIVIVYSILPFLQPGLNYSRLRGLHTSLDLDGICRQGTHYSCGPAAAVTALRRLGYPAEEGELAILAHTTPIAGTPADSLCRVMQERFGGDGLRCQYRAFNTVSELTQLPVIATIKYGLLVDHFVAVLAVTDDEVVIGDPLRGKVVMSHEDFNAIWRQTGIVLLCSRSDVGAQSGR